MNTTDIKAEQKDASMVKRGMYRKKLIATYSIIFYYHLINYLLLCVDHYDEAVVNRQQL